LTFHIDPEVGAVLAALEAASGPMPPPPSATSTDDVSF
jgi:hypothetical protein